MTEAEDEAATLVPGQSRRERDELITSHLYLTESLARRFARRGVPYEDVRQAASLSLVRAATRYDPSRGVEFAAFAARTIVGDLKHQLRDQGWAMHTPRALQELYLEIGRVTEELDQRFGRAPTVHEIASAVGRRDDEVIEALEAGRQLRLESLDAAETDTGPRVAAVGNFETDVDEADVLMRSTATLPPREREILKLRFVDELSQSEIAHRMGMSQMHVSRLLRQALSELREQLNQ